MSIPITFARKYVYDYYISEFRQSIFNCYLYEVWMDGAKAGNFYYGSNHSLIVLPGRIARIDYERHFFRKSQFRMYDHTTRELLCHYDFHYPKWGRKLGCVINFSDGAVYSFAENNSHRRLFKPATWGLSRYDLGNSVVDISYFFKHRGGRIESNTTDQLMVIMAGFFIIEEIWRRNSE